MFCSECGTKADDTAKFCMQCGQNLKQPAGAAPSSAPPPTAPKSSPAAIQPAATTALAKKGQKRSTGRRIILLLLIGFSILVLVGFCRSLLPDSDSPSTTSSENQTAQEEPIDVTKYDNKSTGCSSSLSNGKCSSSKATPSPQYTPTCKEFKAQAEYAAENYGQSSVDLIRTKGKAAGCKMPKLTSNVKATKPNAGPSNTKAFRPLDGNVSYRWVKNPNCSYGSCVQMRIKAEAGCSGGLYMEVNWVDKNNTVVDWTNDSVPSLAPNQKAVLTFTNFLDGTQSAQIADWTCRL